jgi:hypothetical protein
MVWGFFFFRHIYQRLTSANVNSTVHFDILKKFRGIHKYLNCVGLFVFKCISFRFFALSSSILCLFFLIPTGIASLTLARNQRKSTWNPLCFVLFSPTSFGVYCHLRRLHLFTNIYAYLNMIDSLHHTVHGRWIAIVDLKCEKGGKKQNTKTELWISVGSSFSYHTKTQTARVHRTDVRRECSPSLFFPSCLLLFTYGSFFIFGHHRWNLLVDIRAAYSWRLKQGRVNYFFPLSASLAIALMCNDRNMWT